MRIGILTQPLHNNYGGILQAYALQRTLMNEQHDVLIIDRAYRDVTSYEKNVFRLKRFLLNLKNRFLKKDILPSPFWISSEQLNQISLHTHSFVHEKINVTDKVFDNFGLLYLHKKHNFDCYIVGSDQVWRPAYSPSLYNYYLDFIKENWFVKRISYAASFGMDTWEYTKKQTTKCSKYISLFDAVSVREDSAISLCRKYFDIEAQLVLDPTMLLEKDDYMELVPMKDEKMHNRLFYYILDSDLKKTSIIEDIATFFNLELFSIMPETLSQKNLERISECVFPPVSDWLSSFIDAKCIVTDSFHGCVFSIIFNKDFWVLGNPDRGMARISSLLRLFGLGDRLIKTESYLGIENIFNNINWEEINAKRKRMQISSLAFLKNNLNN